MLSNLLGPVGIHSQLCYGESGQFNNLPLETCLFRMWLPVQHTEKANHIELCDFRPCSGQCAVGKALRMLSCLTWRINTSPLQPFWKKIVFFATDISLPGAVDWVMMQSCFGFHIMLVLKKQKYNAHQEFFAIVHLIGTRKQAENFVFDLS